MRLLKWLTIVMVGMTMFLTSALTANAFSVQPVKYYVAINRGESQTVSVTITNPETTDVRFALGVIGVKQDEAGRPQFGIHTDEAEAWVVPATQNSLVPAGGEKKVSFTIAVPSDADPGLSHAVGLTIEPEVTPAGTVGLGSQIVVLVNVQVAGRAHEALSISRWQAEHTIFTGKQWPTNLVMENTGTVVMPVRGDITVTNSAGQVLVHQDVALGNQMLAQAVRRIAPIVDVAGTGIWPGRYNLNVQLLFGRTQQSVTATTGVWYAPHWQYGVFVLVAGLIVFIKIIKRRRPKLVNFR